MYTPHVQITDKYNNRTIYAPQDGYAGAALSETALSYEMWYPVAGFKRGKLNVEDTRIRFSEGEMSFLYDNGINPIRFYPGKGIMIWGQKTLLGRPSALDRLNVRLLLIVIGPAISEFLENFLFDLNTDQVWSLAESAINDYMNTVKARRGVYEFYTQIDEDNNTPNDIDNHIMNVRLFVKPTISLEYIPFQVVITRTGVSLQLVAEQM
jgi:phage tail sheath protein FI